MRFEHVGIMDKDPDIRELFTQIGCIMEDASLIALIGKDADPLSITERIAILRKHNQDIAMLLDKIDRLIGQL